MALSSSSLRVLSLGAGIQSTALLMLALDGDLDADCAVFADTGWEPAEVYDHLAVLKDECQAAGFPLHEITVSNIFEDMTGDGRVASPPFYTLNRNGEHGILKRQCTSDYKTGPIKRKARELLGYHPSDAPHPPANSIVMIQGISIDEWWRMRTADTGFLVYEYPLVEREWSRTRCEQYLREQHGMVSPKSACIGCPYRGDRRWLYITDAELDEVERFEQAAQSRASIKETPFVHKSRQPIREAVAVIRKFHHDNPELITDDAFGCDSGACGV